jgi:uracil-DNA glycosylase
MKNLEYFAESTAAIYDASWDLFFQKESKKDYFSNLRAFLENEFSSKIDVFPPKSMIFNSFRQCPLDKVKVVILGQDPYHGYGQAHGLSFSVCQGVAPPPSLKNIFNELMTDLHIKTPPHGCLLSWAHQGVLLLNATLSVRSSSPKSHYGQGWEVFTDHVISEIAQLDRPIVFMLWGKSAQEKCLHALGPSLSKKHLVLQTTHPSPFSARSGFLGCRHFSKANDFLEKSGVAPIDWSVK